MKTEHTGLWILSLSALFFFGIVSFSTYVGLSILDPTDSLSFFLRMPSFFYFATWLLLLFFSFKTESARLLKLYQIFWLLSALFFLLASTSSTPGPIMFLGVLVFFTPMVGVISGIPGSVSAVFALAILISFVMSLLGIFAQWKRKK